MEGPNPHFKKKKGVKQRLIDIFIPQKGDSQRTLISKIIALLAAVLIVIALVMIGLLVRKYVVKNIELDKGKDLYNPSSEITSTVNSGESDTDSGADDIWYDVEPEWDPDLDISVDFVDLYNVNPDVVGYLSIPDTKLEMPVVKGTDNEFYLDHTLEKKYNPFGIPFADYRVTIANGYQSDNITIYGHAAKDGTFFAPVKEYKDIEFYKTHPTLNFNTIYGDGMYKIFAVALVNTDLSSPELFNYHDYSDLSEPVFNGFLEEIYKRAYYTTDVDVKYGDKILTLSTCDTEIIDSLQTPYRVALFARKVRNEESMTVDVSKAAPNEDMVMPEAWVSKMGKKNPYS